MVGPRYIDEIDPDNPTLDGRRYVEMLETQGLPVFREKLGHRYDQCIYQQDGASPHRSRVAMDFLRKELGNRLIALNSRAKHEWPAHSPDLNPLDYWFWSSMRTLLNQHDARTTEELKMAACLICEQVAIDEVSKAISDFPLRLEALIESKGAHFQRTFKAFKIARRGQSKCNICDTIHPCDCPDCDEICLANALVSFGLQDRQNNPIDPFGMDID